MTEVLQSDWSRTIFQRGDKEVQSFDQTLSRTGAGHETTPTDAPSPPPGTAETTTGHTESATETSSEASHSALLAKVT